MYDKKTLDKALAGGPSPRSLAMQKDLRKNPNLSVNELVKRQTVDTSSLNQLIKKTEENIAFDKKHPPLISTKTMLDNGLIDPEAVMVKYDSSTGLFTNKEKTIGFKDAVSARKHNQVYEPYSPTVQKLNKAVTPTQASPQQMDYLKKNLDKMKYQNAAGDRKVRKYILNQVKQKSKIPEFKINNVIPSVDLNLLRKPERSARDIELERNFNKMVEDQRLEKARRETSGIAGILGAKSES